MPYTVLSHTADTGIEATAPTLEALISELAAGMFSLVARVDGPLEVEAKAEVASPSTEGLVVDVLSDLLYLSEVEELVFAEFQVSVAVENTATVLARGVSLEEAEVTGPPIKAVTYHDLVVEETADGWLGRVYFDV